MLISTKAGVSHFMTSLTFSRVSRILDARRGPVKGPQKTHRKPRRAAAGPVTIPVDACSPHRRALLVRTWPLRWPPSGRRPAPHRRRRGARRTRLYVSAEDGGEVVVVDAEQRRGRRPHPGRQAPARHQAVARRQAALRRALGLAARRAGRRRVEAAAGRPHGRRRRRRRPRARASCCARCRAARTPSRSTCRATARRSTSRTRRPPR